MRDQGMTLIEVLVAVMLLGTVLVVLGAAIPAGLTAVTRVWTGAHRDRPRPGAHRRGEAD